MIYQHDVGRGLTNDEADFNLDTLRARYKTLTGQDMPVTLRRDLARPLTPREMDANVQGLDQALMRAEYGDGPYPVFDQVFGAGARFLDPRITLSRPGKSWRTVNGVLREYDVNEPCLTGDGWSVRPAETNLVWPSEDLTSARYNKSRCSASDTLSIQGWTLQKITGTENSANGAVIHSPVGTIVGTNGAVSATIYHASSPTWACLQISDTPANNGGRCWVNLASGELGSTQLFGSGFSAPTATVEVLGVGLVRVHLKATCPANSEIRTQIRPRVPGNLMFDVNIGDESYAGCVSVNAGDPIPYIPTTDSAVTRPADNASIQGDAFASVWNPMEGAVLLDGVFIGQRGTINSTFSTSRIIQTPLFYLYPSGANNRLYLVNKTVTNEAYTSADGFFDGSRNKIAVSWENMTLKLALNGEIRITLPYTEPLTSTDGVFIRASNSARLTHLIKRFRVFDRALSDAQMEAMTS